MLATVFMDIKSTQRILVSIPKINFYIAFIFPQYIEL